MIRTIRCVAALAIAGALTSSLHAADSVPPATIYASPNGVPLKLYAFSPEQSSVKPRAAILLFHSGGWVYWIERTVEVGTGTELLRAVEALALPIGGGYAWITAESDVARSVRPHPLDERGFGASG